MAAFITTQISKDSSQTALGSLTAEFMSIWQ